MQASTAPCPACSHAALDVLDPSCSPDEDVTCTSDRQDNHCSDSILYFVRQEQRA